MTAPSHPPHPSEGTQPAEPGGRLGTPEFGVQRLRYRVVIVGAGPAGLTAAARLAPRLGPGQVLVLDREETAGGIPRHSDHPGYGIRDLNRFLSGPAYAAQLAARATRAGARIRTAATVTGWCGERVLEVTTPEGRLEIEGDAVVLATGARERPRAARLTPGDRPQGVYTTGQLQNLVHLHGRTPGRRAVILGAEPVSWSAALTLRQAGCATALLTTEHPVPDAPPAFTFAGRTLLRVPVATRTRVTHITGRGRLSRVEIEHTATGARRTVDCDTLVLTGDWVPEHELARSAGLELDTGTRGPLVDTALRTSRPGVFAAGNVLHPVDTADVAALDGAHVATQVLHRLTGAATAPGAAADETPAPVPVVAEWPFRWAAPGLLHPAAPAPPRRQLSLWAAETVRFPVVVVRQDDRELARYRSARTAAPGRVFRVPWRLLSGYAPDGGPVRIGLVAGDR